MLECPEDPIAAELPFFERGQSVRWRGRRWRVLEEETGGFLKLVGLDPVNRNQLVTPLLRLEHDAIEPDIRPLPELNVEASDRGRWRALHEAFLIGAAGGREQLIGLDWGAIIVEPYQLVPLLRVAKSLRPRLLIADDTGLGKTAEAGLVLRWLAQRHQANRVLVVTRASPEPERWQRELWIKFGFRFDILKNGADFAERRRRSPTVNVFAQQSRLIVSMTLAARQLFLDELRHCPTPFDVVIVDEAHHLAERGQRTKRLALLGRVLAEKSARGALLLLTATPHDGKSESFLSLLKLLDPLIETSPGEVPVEAASRLFVRRLKSEVTLVGGREFVEPVIHVTSTLSYATREEEAVSRPLDEYLTWLEQEEERYLSAGARQKAHGCQFLKSVYRKRFGSSVAALRATLRRRLQLPPAPEDSDELVPFVETEASDPEDEIIDPGAQADSPPPPLSAREQEVAAALLQAAERVPPGRDSKLEAMIDLLRRRLPGEKVVVFTEYRDTLRAARRRLEAEGIPFVLFHGDTPEGTRDQVMRDFIQSPSVQVFLATDAASEGKNLQRSCRHLIHLDVPWNPNRYAQRNGRIDRYGQTQEPHIWVLVAADRKKGAGRPEHRALEVVIEKLQKIQRELGSISPVLPGYMSGSVTDVLLRSQPDAEQQMERTLEDPSLEQVHRELSRLAARNQREIQEATAYVRRLGTIDDFEETTGRLLSTAFHGWDDGGRLESADPNIVRVRIPRRLVGDLGTDLINRATFRRELAVAGQDEEEGRAPEFLSPGHPLVAQTLQGLRDEASDPAHPHRFDVEVGEPEGLVVSFLSRFMDGDGRTVEEQLVAVEVLASGKVTDSPDRDLDRLGIRAPSVPSSVPHPEAVSAWKSAFPSLYEVALEEARRRAEQARRDLETYAQRLWEEELELLAQWKGEETKVTETLTLGSTLQPSLDAWAAFDQRMTRLEAEYERRKAMLRNRSEIRLAGLELIGGRLIVRGYSP